MVLLQDLDYSRAFQMADFAVHFCFFFIFDGYLLFGVIRGIQPHSCLVFP